MTEEAKSPTERVVAEILSERERQVKGEGWSTEDDDSFAGGRLAGAAACYSINAAWRLSPETGGEQLEGVPVWWPMESSSWKPKTPRKDLVRAAALIVAEIERIDRENEKKTKASHP